MECKTEKNWIEWTTRALSSARFLADGDARHGRAASERAAGALPERRASVALHRPRVRLWVVPRASAWPHPQRVHRRCGLPNPGLVLVGPLWSMRYTSKYSRYRYSQSAIRACNLINRSVICNRVRRFWILSIPTRDEHSPTFPWLQSAKNLFIRS